LRSIIVCFFEILPVHIHLPEGDTNWSQHMCLPQGAVCVLGESKGKRRKRKCVLLGGSVFDASSKLIGKGTKGGSGSFREAGMPHGCH
jgi:hypothetical protein